MQGREKVVACAANAPLNKYTKSIRCIACMQQDYKITVSQNVSGYWMKVLLRSSGGGESQDGFYS